MTNGIQTQEGTERQEYQTLDSLLTKVGALKHTSNELNNADSYREQLTLSRQLALILADGDNESPIFREAIDEINDNPYRGFTMANEAIARVSKEDTEPLYNKYKPKVIDEVVGSIQNTIKGKTKAEAAEILKDYLTGLIDVGKPDQQTLNNAANASRADRLRIYRAKNATGTISEYEDLMLRIEASKYLKDTKNDKDEVVGYTLDTEKVGKLMDNVATGAVVYTNYKGIKQAYEAAAEAEAEKAKK